MKTCKICNTPKEMIAFSKDKQSKDGLSNRCKKCAVIATKIWQTNNKDKHLASCRSIYAKRTKTQKRDKWLKWKFGISAEEYNKKFQAQGGVCAICGQPEKVKNRSLAQDHNHKTGQLRGLLCWAHNSMLGKVNESKEILLNMIEYIEK